MSENEGAGISEAARIGRFMGLPQWRKLDDLALVDRVREGFPAETADNVVKHIDPDGRFMKATDIIPRSTLHRRKARPLTKDESEKVLALSKVFTEVLRIYRNDSDLAARFLCQTHPMLGGRAPIELAKDSIAGADVVLKLLARADASVAA